MTYLLALALGYLLGSVPWGLLLTRAAGLGDIRAIGSGNIGATNVLRTGNWALAAATVVLDAAKGGGVLLSAAPWLGAVTAAVWLAIALATRISSAAALAACAAAPVAALLAGRTDLALFSAGVAALVAYRHRANIGRLLAGTEPRFGRGGGGA